MKFFPFQHLAVEMVGMEVSGQHIDSTGPSQEIIVHDAPVAFGFRRVFVVIDDDGYALRFNGKPAMIYIMESHRLIVVRFAILHILIGVTKQKSRNHGVGVLFALFRYGIRANGRKQTGGGRPPASLKYRLDDELKNRSGLIGCRASR